MADILIADDEEPIREFLVRALEHEGHRVTAVSDGAAALETLEAQRCDLLLADIVMPQIDGIALALKAGKDFPGLKIVLMTGYAAERERAHNLDALVHDVVAKPFTLEQIREVVAAALAAPPRPR
ncbi:MAG: response regulator [Alphaproteobacteria bacterium]